MYINLKQATEKAEELNCTIGAFNAHNLDMLPPMIEAAKESGSPIIIQTSVDTAKYIGFKTLVNVARGIAEFDLVDVVLHLDHAKNFADIKQAIDAGYSSVMFDGSSLPLKENIMKTKAVVDYAHKFDVSVEGELGIIGGTEEGVTIDGAEVMYTEPEDAKYFAETTNVDALAVAIGTNHGQFKSKTDVNIPLLKKINNIVNTSLVIHGGTGVKEEHVPELIDNGIRKFNVGTELLVTWTEEAKKCFSDTKVNKSLRHNIIPCNDAVKNIVSQKINLFMNKDSVKL
ncbi:class II fructose-bisphosphate aldolase [Staphylococcus succinus]|uniref:class II fructose-bisphosphate aldolase n=1 Tax=Staphylococcus succinus TaxID=61015 RepID=UPI000E69E0F4|nr:class II fructose-bisphosphate aldolase [Staphylococcus succinus]RIN22976.1 ketose-bisphosphate aldolase [Staphylococcus succinus]